MATKTIKALLLVLLGISVERGPVSAQLAPANASPIATVTFVTWSGGPSPPYFSVAITSLGNVSYWSLPNSDQHTGEPYMVEFAASDATRTEIFQLAQKLNFFRGNFKLAHPRTGMISLTFAEGPIKNQIFYTSSRDHSIKRLTALFESISASLEYGRTLEQLRTGNPNRLAAELKQMARQTSHGRLVEVQAIAPVLRRIASDPAIPETSRHYAQSVLAKTHLHEG